MKIVRNKSPWPYSDTEWKVDAHLANDVVTLSIVTNMVVTEASASNLEANSEVLHSTVTKNVEFGNVKVSFNLSDIRSNFVDHGAIAFLTSKHPALEHPQVDTQQTVQNQTTTVHELFQLTNASKMRFRGIQNVYDKLVYATVMVPFADSTNDELILMLRSPINANVVMNTSGFGNDLGSVSSNAWRKTGTDESTQEMGWLSLLPSLKSDTLNVGVNTTTNFSVQLIDGNGNNISRAGVTIYLDNTGGTLSQSRIVTNEHGVATGSIIATSVPTEFKIKAGFKYFTGVIDIPVTVS
jgi:hypothetical protein